MKNRLTYYVNQIIIKTQEGGANNEKYKRKEEKKVLKKLKEMQEIVKELIKLVEQLDELAIRIISLLGWIFILIYIITK